MTTRQRMILELAMLLGILATIACRSHGANVRLSDGTSLQAAINAAHDGDVLLLADGRYPGGADLRGRTGITIRAAKYSPIASGTAAPSGALIIGQIGGGNNISLQGVTVSGANTNWDQGAVSASGTGWTIEDVVIRDNASIGLDLHGAKNVTVRRVRSTHNGAIGISTGDANGAKCDGVLLEDVEVDSNNYGLPNPPWAGIAGKTYRAASGLWYRLPGDAAGGAKICMAANVTIRRMRAHDNIGPGLWFDVYDDNVSVSDSESWNNRNIVPGQSWEAPGFAVEICGGLTRFTNCYAHGNTGSDFAVWEAKNVTIDRCIAGSNGVEVRNLGGDRGNPARGNWWTQNLVISNTAFVGVAKIFRSANSLYPGQSSAWTESGNRYALPSVPAWSAGPTPTPPPTPDPQPTTNPVPTIPLVKTLTDGAGNRWSLDGNGQLWLDGVLRAETNGVIDIALVDGVLYQTAHGLFWAWCGGWVSVSVIPASTQPVPPPTPATDPIVEVRIIRASGKTEVSRP